MQANDVFIVFNEDSNVVNAVIGLGNAVELCCAHRLDTVVAWILGIGGYQATCKNAPMETLMKKLAACVSKFCHLVVSNTS